VRGDCVRGWFSMRFSTGASGSVQGWSEEGEVSWDWDQLGCHCVGGGLMTSTEFEGEG